MIRKREMKGFSKDWGNQKSVTEMTAHTKPFFLKPYNTNSSSPPHFQM